jgi:ubiquinone/menaquinone biosynthesis C-methylase UbiE
MEQSPRATIHSVRCDPDAKRILDVGCGTGSLTFALADKPPHASIVGMDCSQAFVDDARSKASDPRLQFEQGDAASLSYRDATFDAAVSLLVLNFVPAAERAAREMRPNLQACQTPHVVHLASIVAGNCSFGE